MMNALEALPDGGNVEMTTSNRYADSELSGFDTVEEGEYVVLSIADSGVGISEASLPSSLKAPGCSPSSTASLFCVCIIC